jgi:hypothetical protein
VPSASYTAPWNSVDGLNDDVAPTSSGDTTPNDNANVWGAYPQVGDQWVQYDWAQPVSVDQARVYFVANLDANGLGIDVPTSWKVQYWDDASAGWIDVTNPGEYGTNKDAFNDVTFVAVTTSKLRIALVSAGTEEQKGSVGIKEWQVYEATQAVPDTTAPVVTTSVDPAAPASGWYTGKVSVSASAVDNRDTSPTIEVKLGDDGWVPYTAPMSIDADGVTTVQFRATDASANVSEPVSVDVKRDTAAPDVTAAADTTARTVTLTATDTASGIGSVEYRVGDGAWQAYAGVVNVGADAATVAYRATDVAGNTSKAGSIQVPTNSTPPTTPPVTGGVSGHEQLHLGVTRVAPGGQVQLAVTGGESGAVFELSLHSDPVTLGSLTIGKDGTGMATVTIPASIQSGTHEIWASLNGATLKASLEVIAPGATSDAGLASTGAGTDWGAYIPYGIGVMLLGGAVVLLVALRRRRSRATH